MAMCVLDAVMASSFPHGRPQDSALKQHLHHAHATILTITFVGRRLARREHNGSDLSSITVKEPRHGLPRFKTRPHY
jgi:hypothetical protein